MKRTQRLVLSGALAGFVLATMAASLAWRSHQAIRGVSSEGTIARVTATLLERSQFTHHPLDNELASRFLDRYLDTLDGAHVLFLKSDLQEFEPYRRQLADLTRDVGDTTPAHRIFQRYLMRLRQQVDYLTNQLTTAEFDFSGHDLYTPDRAEAPRPADLATAQGLWKQRLRYDYLQELLAGQDPAEIVHTLSGRYVRAAEQMSRLNDDEVLGLYLDALAHVYDPHSDYFDPEQLEDFSIAMNLRLFGVGATLLPQDGYCTIRDLLPGGPAARSGEIHPGDRIVAVTQPGEEPVDIVGMPLRQAVQLIRGPKGTPVILTILPADAPMTGVRQQVRLVRDEIRLEEQRAKAQIVDLPGPAEAPLRLGVIDLPSFYGATEDGSDDSKASASKDVRVLLAKLKQEQVQGIILDLRRNGGGSLPEAIELTGLFIQKGAVVQTRDLKGDIDVDKDPDPREVYGGPLIVLTSRMSASASEILAGALRDYGRALVVGDPSTFGKGTVQSMVPLDRFLSTGWFHRHPDAGALAVTIRKFYRPAGASTQIQGVRSDIVLPSLTDNPKISEAAQDNALPWDEVAPQPIRDYDLVEPHLRSLRTEAATRVARQADLIVLREAAAELKKHREDDSVVLNLVERKAEAAEQKAREARWKQQLAQMHQPTVSVWQITVDDAGTTGLPAAKQIPFNEQSLLRETRTNSLATGGLLWQRADGIVLAEAERILRDYVEAADTASLPVTAGRSQPEADPPVALTAEARSRPAP